MDPAEAEAKLLNQKQTEQRKRRGSSRGFKGLAEACTNKGGGRCERFIFPTQILYPWSEDLNLQPLNHRLT